MDASLSYRMPPSLRLTLECSGGRASYFVIDLDLNAVRALVVSSELLDRVPSPFGAPSAVEFVMPDGLGSFYTDKPMTRQTRVVMECVTLKVLQDGVGWIGETLGSAYEQNGTEVLSWDDVMKLYRELHNATMARNQKTKS